MNVAQEYEPRPIPTGHIVLPPELEELREVLARNAHDVWAVKRLEEGGGWGRSGTRSAS